MKQRRYAKLFLATSVSPLREHRRPVDARVSANLATDGLGERLQLVERLIDMRISVLVVSWTDTLVKSLTRYMNGHYVQYTWPSCPSDLSTCRTSRADPLPQRSRLKLGSPVTVTTLEMERFLGIRGPFLQQSPAFNAVLHRNRALSIHSKNIQPTVVPCPWRQSHCWSCLGKGTLKPFSVSF